MKKSYMKPTSVLVNLETESVIAASIPVNSSETDAQLKPNFRQPAGIDWNEE